MSDHDWLEFNQVTRTKFRCQQCGDDYVFVELGDLPRYCPTCGADQEDHE